VRWHGEAPGAGKDHLMSKSITVLLVNDQAPIIRILDAETVRVGDDGHLHVGSAAIFAAKMWLGAYETEKGTL
jgi:hypothetical protein